MDAVHAVWTLDRRLHLWAEDAAAYERPVPRTSRTAHPFATTPAALEALVEQLAPGIPSTPATLELQLPSGSGGPLPSPMLPVTPHSGGEMAPRRWTVPSRAFGRGALVDLVASLGRDAGDALDPSLNACVRIGRLAADLVDRVRVLPLLESGGASFEARWVSVAGSADLARFHALAWSLPGSLRSASALATPGALETVTAIADEVVDALARRAIGTAHGRSQGFAARLALPLEAFASAEREVVADTAQTRALANALAAWREAVKPADAPVRVVFRLHEPRSPKAEADADADADADAPASAEPASDSVGEAEPEPWHLEMLMGARADPSLMVPASEIWRGASPFGGITRLRPDEILLGDLGRATRLYPPLEPALAEARPTGLDLDAAGAYLFLRDGAPALAEAGFGVQVPGWWRQRRRRLGLRLQTRRPPGVTTSPSPLGVEALVAYDWQVALGDATLTADELHRLAELKQPLVRVRGEWVELPPGEVSAALEAVHRGTRGGRRTGGRNDQREMTVAEALRAILGLEAGPGGLPVVGVDADPESAIAALLDGGAPVAAGPLATPDGFAGQLRPYQERGLGWLVALDRTGFGACLADDMGLGKTPQLLALLLVSIAEEKGAGGPTLLVCPMSVVGNWQREAARFTPGLRVVVHHGPDRPAGEAFGAAVASADLVVTTYAIAQRDRSLLATIPWRRIVLDEAQAIKNSETAQSKAIRSLPAVTRVALTGTPVENRLSDLWSIMEFLNPGLLGSERDFRTRLAVPIESERDDDAAEKLRRLTGPFILRRVKTDPAIAPDLPDKIEITVPCNLTREQASLYQATVNEMLLRIERADDEGDQASRRGNVLAAMTRLKQVCNHPAHLLGDGSALPGRSGKLAQLEVILDEVLAEGDRALVFTQFAEWGGRLREHLRDRYGREVLYLHGGVSKAGRDEMVARFQAGAAPIFLLSLRAGGTGLNLTAANHVIHFDRWWNPAVEDQASDRAFRLGQTRNVQVRALVCGGTIEERIAEMMAAKRDLAGRIVTVGERWITELSTAELRDLLALSSDAVSEED